MKSIKLSSLFFIAIIAAAPACYSLDVLDNSLLPKFICLSITLIVVIGLLFKKLIKSTPHLVLLDVSLILYLIFHIISLFQAIDQPDGIYETTKIFLMICTYFVAKHFIRNDRESAFHAIAISALIATFIALFSSVEELFAAFRMRVPFSSANYTISGLVGHKNMLSNWFLFLIPLNALGFYFHKKTPKILFKLGLAIQLIMVALLMTRAVYLGLFAAGILFFIISKYKSNPKTKTSLQYAGYFLIAAIGIICLLAFFEKLPQIVKLDPSQSSSTVERLFVWDKTLNMIKEHFLLGVGAGNWKVWLPNEGLEGLRRTLDGKVIFSRPHNDYLWIWAELGVGGIIAFLASIGIATKAAWKRVFQKENIEKPALLALCGLIAYLVVAFFDFPKERIEANIAFATFLAILAIESEAYLKPISFRFKAVIPVIIAIPSLVFCTYFALDRFESESFLRKAIAAKDLGDQVGLKVNTEKAASPFMLSDNNGVPVCWYTGVALYNLNQREQASILFKKALEINPYNFNVTNNVGTAYFLEGNYEQAKVYYLETLRINPYFENAMLNLAASYINTGDKANARTWLNRVNTNSARLQELRALAQ